MTDLVDAAERDAADARVLLAELEQAIIERAAGERPEAAAVAAQRAAVEFAERRVGVARERSAKAAADARLAALRGVAGEVDGFAVEGTAELRKALQGLVSSARKVRHLAAEHDGRVAGLLARARELGVEPPALDGPRASSAHLRTRGTTGIQHGTTLVQMIGGVAEEAIQAAVGGDGGHAQALMADAVQHRDIGGVPRRFLRASGGAIFTFGEELPKEIGRQLAAGQLTELSQAQAQAFLDGILDGSAA